MTANQQIVTTEEGQASRWRLYVDFALDARRNAIMRRQMARELPSDPGWCSYNALEARKAYERAFDYLAVARRLREDQSAWT